MRVTIDLGAGPIDISGPGLPPVHIELRAANARVASIAWSGPDVRVLLGCGASLQHGDQLLERLESLSLMPSYCWDRVPPQAIAGAPAVAGYYQRIPGVILVDSREAVFVPIPAWLEVDGRAAMTFQSVHWEQSGGRIEVHCPQTYESLQTSAERYHQWVEGPLERKVVQNWSGAGRASLRCGIARSTSEESMLAILAGRFARAALEARGARLQPVANQAASYLSSSYHVPTGLVLEWKWRDRAGFKSPGLSLPAYHAGIRDLRPSDAPEAQTIRRSLIRIASHSAALTSTRFGPAWHNSATIGIPTGVKFFSHLGVGIAGYPGGSAVLLRAIGESEQESPGETGLLDRARMVAQTLVRARTEMNYWPRDLDAPEANAGVGSASEALAGVLAVATAERDRAQVNWVLRELASIGEALTPSSTLGGYLRDNRAEEPDGVSWIFVLEAAASAASIDADPVFRRMMRTAASALVRWCRHEPAFGLDPVLYSFGPRIAPCEGFWASAALARAGHITESDWMLDLARSLFAASACEEGLLGLSEAVYVDVNRGLYPHGFACAYTAFAAIGAARCIDGTQPTREAWRPLGQWTRRATRERWVARIQAAFA